MTAARGLLVHEGEVLQAVPALCGLITLGFTLRRAGQRDIDRLEVAARLQDDPVRAVLDKEDLGTADQQRAGSHMYREGPPRGEVPP